MKNLRRRHTAVCVLACSAILGAALWGGTLKASPSDTDPRIDAVLAQQQAYVQKITSLQFDAKKVVSYGEARREKGVPVDSIEIALRYVTSGTKYRAESTYGNPAIPRANTLTLAFDGEKYQSLDRLSGRANLSVTRSRPSVNVYPGVHPLVVAFKWALLAEEERSLAQLQEADTWSQVRPLVTHCEGVTMADIEGVEHDGTRLTLQMPPTSWLPEGVSHEVFFAGDLDYLPVHCKTKIPGRSTCDLYIVATEARDTPAGPVRIPTRFEWEAYFDDGRLSEIGYLQVVSSTLVVNQPVDDSVFTIPVSGVDRYIDEDTGATIMPSTAE